MVSISELSELQIKEFQRLIKWKVRRCFGNCFSNHDQEDACSQVMFQLLQKVRAFEPKRSSLNTFAARITDSAIRDIRRESRAKKRDLRHINLSLRSPTPTDDGTPCELLDTLDSSFRARRLQTVVPDQIKLVDFSLDLKSELIRLSKSEKRLVRLLLSDLSIRRIAKELCVSTKTIYRRLAVIRLKLKSWEILQ